MSGEDTPLPVEVRVTGIFAVILYTLIIVLAMYLISRGVRSKNTAMFLYLLFFMATCEIPRFMIFAVTERYYSTIAYSIHIFASTLFFLAFSHNQWSGLMKLSNYSSLFNNPRDLFGSIGTYCIVAINLTFIVVDLTAMVECLESRRLSDFFFITILRLLQYNRSS